MFKQIMHVYEKCLVFSCLAIAIDFVFHSRTNLPNLELYSKSSLRIETEGHS